MSVKNIVTNVAALKSKYGTNYPIIEAALTPLIGHDRAKGIVTTLYDVSDPVQMAKISAPVIKSKTSAQQFKKTFDAIIENTNPHASMILGGADIVPLVQMVNPVSGPDEDPYVPSDLPYACSAPYSTHPRQFLAPSRVLTRLPDITGGSDANYLAALLRTPVSYRAVKASTYTDTYYSPGVAKWQGELENALTAVFGNYDYLYLCPPDGPNWTSAQYQQQFHFINCHGSSNDPNFYGESAGLFPEAMESALVSGRLTNGMGCVAACCYSTQLYNPYTGAGSPPLPMSNTYLQSNAIFYMGSSVICYGGSPNENANLAAAEFAKRIFAGDTVGEAMLETWQALSRSFTASRSRIALKTLIEFMAFGDVTTAPVDVTLFAGRDTKTDRALTDGLRRNLFEAVADQLAVPGGYFEPIGESDVEDGVLAGIKAHLEAEGVEPAGMSHAEWVYPELRPGRDGSARPQSLRSHIVYARSDSGSIFDFDLAYEFFEVEGKIVSANAHPRR